MKVHWLAAIAAAVAVTPATASAQQHSYGRAPGRRAIRAVRVRRPGDPPRRPRRYHRGAPSRCRCIAAGWPTAGSSGTCSPTRPTPPRRARRLNHSPKLANAPAAAVRTGAHGVGRHARLRPGPVDFTPERSSCPARRHTLPARRRPSPARSATRATPRSCGSRTAAGSCSTPRSSPSMSRPRAIEFPRRRRRPPQGDRPRSRHLARARDGDVHREPRRRPAGGRCCSSASTPTTRSCRRWRRTTVAPALEHLPVGRNDAPTARWRPTTSSPTVRPAQTTRSARDSTARSATPARRCSTSSTARPGVLNGAAYSPMWDLYVASGRRARSPRATAPASTASSSSSAWRTAAGSPASAAARSAPAGSISNCPLILHF